MMPWCAAAIAARSLSTSIATGCRDPETPRTGVSWPRHAKRIHAGSEWGGGSALGADEGDGAVEEGGDVLVLAFEHAVEPVGDRDFELSRLDRAEHGLDHRVDREHLHPRD